MLDKAETKNIGLRGIVVADTKISDVDGQRGRLIYRGFTIETLSEHSTFEETAYLLLNGELPTRSQLQEFDQALRRERALPAEMIKALQLFPKTATPMDVIQAAVPRMATFDPELTAETRKANENKAIRIMAKLPTVVAAWQRIREGKEPVVPRQNLSHAANFLYMLSAQEPHAAVAREMDVCLILHADHSFNASTFACRQVASTRAHMYASIAAGIGALSGELHGGANSEVMRMLLEIGDIHRAESWVKSTLEAGKRVMGMGHAVYKVLDPRAKVLKRIAEQVTARTGNAKWFELAKKVEDVARREFERRGKGGIWANVDFYSAATYYSMGIPVDQFTPVFAIARASGWSSHVIEEKFAEAQPKPALYRPESDYIGRDCGPEGCAYVPLDQRK